MSRLIDADVFEVVCFQGKSEEFCEGAKYILEMLDAQPTAYDIDKVVAELKKEKENSPCRNTQCEDCKYTNQCYEGEMCYKVGFDNAIGIVRKGGVE